MLGWILDRFVESRIAASERELGVEGDWARDFYRVAPRAFFKFSRFLPLAHHREIAPKDLWVLAHLIGAKCEDCGPCVQIAINLGLKEGVAASLLKAAYDGDHHALDPRQSLCVRFAESVARNQDDCETLRLNMVAEIGERATAELALTIAAVRVFPTLKRGLGHAQACRIMRFAA